MVLFIAILCGIGMVICGVVGILYGIWYIKNAVNVLGGKTTKE